MRVGEEEEEDTLGRGFKSLLGLLPFKAGCNHKVRLDGL
jgi:hypothetical protein